jgi:AcrR family transcriptional regulator
MGISDRKKREKAKMQKLILETANSLFTKGGLDNISIRKIADIIEYSPATIYLHFKDKDEIINNLRDKSIDDFLKKLEEYSFIKDYFGRLKNLSTSWIDFAITNPAKYQLIFIENGKIDNDRIFEYISPIVFQTIGENRIQRMPVKEGTMMIISFLHGLSYIFMTRKFEIRTKVELKEYAGNIINRFLNSLKGGY